MPTILVVCLLLHFCSTVLSCSSQHNEFVIEGYKTKLTSYCYINLSRHFVCCYCGLDYWNKSWFEWLFKIWSLLTSSSNLNNQNSLINNNKNWINTITQGSNGDKYELTIDWIAVAIKGFCDTILTLSY